MKMKVSKQIWNPLWETRNKIINALAYALAILAVWGAAVTITSGQTPIVTGTVTYENIQYAYTHATYTSTGAHAITLSHDGISAFYTWRPGETHTPIKAWDPEERVLVTTLAPADSVMVWDNKSVKHIAPKPSDGLPPLKWVQAYFTPKPLPAGNK